MAQCPSCGSSNISFRRESVGEVRGRGAKQVVHRTVGVCKDCGYTWERSSDEIAIKKPRKTWLWVLGWIFIFPVPLTILMLRKKDMNSILKIAIIVIGWLVYFAIGYGGGAGQTTTTSTKPVSKTPIDVEVAVEPVVNSDNGKVLFKITTNLPEDTSLLVTVTSEDKEYMGQDKAVVLSNGVANTAEFSNAGGGESGDVGEGLKGRYVVEVTTGIADVQPASVKERIGNKGQYLTGPYVTKSSISDSNMVKATFYFEF